MPDFKISMYYIQFRLGLRLIPHWESVQHSPDPLAGFKGLILLGEVEGSGRDGRGKEGAIFSRNISLTSAPLCESMTHRLTAVGAVTCDHKITTDNKLYKP